MSLQNLLASGLASNMQGNPSDTPIKILITPSPSHPLSSFSPAKYQNRYKKKGLSLTNNNPRVSLPLSVHYKPPPSVPWCGGAFTEQQHQLNPMLPYPSSSFQQQQLINFIQPFPQPQLQSRIVRNPQSLIKQIDLSKAINKSIFNEIESNLARSAFEEIPSYNPRRTIVDRSASTATKKRFFEDDGFGKVFSGIDYNNRLVVNSRVGDLKRAEKEFYTGKKEEFSREKRRYDDDEDRSRKKSMKKTELMEFHNRHRKTQYTRNWN